MGVFSCAFTRRECAHTPLFHPEYQRTNRTKENKILRCFPHCCPAHMQRSFCGAPLHVQVDYHSHAHAFEQPTCDDELFVFAHFRPQSGRALHVGDSVQASQILSSIQSDDKPTGEWIASTLVASAGRNAWLFRVNPEARWYYNWVSSASREKRATLHVLELVVLHLSPLTKTFRVVAQCCSPPFTLVSFRRAPLETRTQGHDDVRQVQESQFVQIESPPFERVRRFPINQSLEQTNYDNEKHRSQDEPMSVLSFPPSPPQLDAPTITRRDPFHSLDTDNSSSPWVARKETLSPSRWGEPSSLSALLRPPWRAHEQPRVSISPVDDTLAKMDELVVVMEFVRSLTLSDAVAELPAMESDLRSQFQSLAIDDSLQKLFHVHRLLVVLGEDVPRASDSTLPPHLVRIAIQLISWMLLNPELAKLQDTFHEKAATSLLIRSAICETHEQSVLHLHRQVERFLWTQSQRSLQSLLREIANSCSPNRDGGFGLSLAEFVAQTREVFLKKRENPLNGDTPIRTQLAGQWLGDLDTVRIRFLARDIDQVPLFECVWLYRQFAHIAISVCKDSHHLPILTAQSALHHSGGRLRLVLDGRPRWFRNFPSGESTSAVCVGGQRFGDYWASYDCERDCIDCAMYSWPTTPSQTKSSDYAYRWRWRLQFAAETRATCSVVLEVSRGSLSPRLARAFELDTHPFEAKHGRVRNWSLVSKARWEMGRQTGNETA